MGHQSYILPYHNFQRRQKILDLIKLHNNWGFDKQGDIMGEELYDVVDVEIIKNIGKFNNKAILCGNGGGRNNTFNFFEKNSILAIPYGSEYEDSFKVISIFSFDLEECNELK